MAAITRPPETEDSKLVREYARSLGDDLMPLMEKIALLMEREAACGTQRYHEQRMVYSHPRMEVQVAIGITRPDDVPYTYAEMGLEEPPERPEDV